MRETFGALLDFRAGQAPDRLAFVGPDGALTYGQWAERSRRLARGFARRGWARGDTVGVQLPNGTAFLLAYAALARLGVTMLTVHMPYRARDVGTLLRHGRAKGAVVAPANAEFDAPACVRSLGLEPVVAAGAGLPELENAPPLERDRAEPDDALVMCFTSGTSDSPKAVTHSHAAMLGNNRAALPRFALGADDVVLSNPPFTHVFGLGVAGLILTAGATGVLLPHYSPAGLVDAVTRHRASVMFATPAHVAGVLAAGADAGADLSSLRLSCLAGSTLASATAQAWEARTPNGRVAQLFGMSEAMMVSIVQHDAPRAERHGTVGRPIDGIAARIADEAGRELPPGAEGELELRGRWLANGYVRNDAATAAAFRADGWFRTGDLARRDAAGAIVLTGRSKDWINRGGIKINPVEIEHAVSAHPAVAMAAAIPVPDPVLGERIGLCILPRPGATLSLDEAVAAVARAGIAKIRWPERLFVVDDMPLTPTRKIVKRELIRRLFE